MTIEEIRSSGMLELYVLGRLTPAEVKLVEDGLSQSAALRAELQDIEKALEYYAQAHSVTPPPELKDRILEEVRKSPRQPNDQKNGGSGKGPWLSGLLILSTLALALALWWQYTQWQTTQQAYNDYRIFCDSITNANQVQIALLNDLNDRNNDIIHVVATEGFPQTDIYFHNNPINQRNYLQIQNLPPITADQAYQLWSLKPDQAPIPMDVFRNDAGELIIPVGFEPETGTYAITIEQRQGAQSPNLANLIGTFTVG